MSSWRSRLWSRVSQARNSSGDADRAQRQHRLAMADLLEPVQRPCRRPAASGSRAFAGPGARPRSRAARRSARRTRRRRAPGRRGRSSGGRGARSRAAARRLALRPIARPSPSSLARRVAGASTRASIASRSHEPQALEPGPIGEVEVDRGDRDPSPRDRRQIGSLLVLERGLEAVDLVPPPALLVLVDQLQLVVVEPLAEPRDLDPRGSPAGQLTLRSVPAGSGSSATARDLGARATPRRRSRTCDRAGSPSPAPPTAARSRSPGRRARSPPAPPRRCPSR